MGLYVDTPTPPNPTATAAAQTNSNVNTAVANTVMQNANTNTPTGSVKYTQSGSTKIPDGNGGFVDVPSWQVDQTLSPSQQHLYDQQTAIGSGMNDLALSQVNRLSGTLNKPLDTSGLPAQVNSLSTPNLQTSFNSGGSITPGVNLNANAATTFDPTKGTINYGIDPTSTKVQTSIGPTDYSQDRTKVEDAIYSRLQPQMDRDTAALQTRLANQGVTQGSQAWNTAIDSLNRSNTDARMQAILAGGQEQSRLAGLDLAKGNFANSAQAQEFGQNQARTNTNNSAQAQDFTQQQARGLFGQQGIAQNNQATLDQGNFANQAQAQQYGQNRDMANFGNTANQQEFANSATAGTFANTARQNAFQQLLAERNQPINEISSLMNGGQVTMPQFQAFQGGNVDSTPIGNYINSNYQTQANNAATTNAGIFGAIGSVAGAGLTAGFGNGGLFRK